MEEEQDTIDKATMIVHWPTGPVRCCLYHGEGLKKLGEFMGAYVHTEPYIGDEPCSNCVNEAKN